MRICAAVSGKLRIALVSMICVSGFSLAASPDNTHLPGAYFRLLEAGSALVEARLDRLERQELNTRTAHARTTSKPKNAAHTEVPRLGD